MPVKCTYLHTATAASVCQCAPCYVGCAIERCRGGREAIIRRGGWRGLVTACHIR